MRQIAFHILSAIHPAGRHRFATLFCLCFGMCIKAQPPAFRMLSYIETYSESAVSQMLEYKIPASVILAQAIFESRSGHSDLAQKSNNHFGIKCHIEWGGDTVVKHDDTLNECFRKYARVEDSYTDHSLFLRSRARYGPLFDLPPADYKAWCYGLKAAGYATYPSYAEDLINIIEQTGLYELDGCQKIAQVDLIELLAPEAKLERPARAPVSPAELSRCGLLCIDERDVLIQSLELLIERPASEDPSPPPPPVDDCDMEVADK